MKRSFALALTALAVSAGIGASGASAKRMLQVNTNHHQFQVAAHHQFQVAAHHQFQVKVDQRLYSRGARRGQL